MSRSGPTERVRGPGPWHIRFGGLSQAVLHLQRLHCGLTSGQYRPPFPLAQVHADTAFVMAGHSDGHRNPKAVIVGDVHGPPSPHWGHARGTARGHPCSPSSGHTERASAPTGAPAADARGGVLRGLMKGVHLQTNAHQQTDDWGLLQGFGCTVRASQLPVLQCGVQWCI